MKKIEKITNLLDLFNDNDFVIKEQNQLLPDSWRKSRVDYAVYKRERIVIEDNPNENVLFDAEEEILSPFCIIIFTSDSASNEVSIRYARQVVKRIIADSAFWFGIVVDKEINVYTNYENASNNYSWKKDINNLVGRIVDVLKSKKLDSEIFRGDFKSAVDNLTANSKNETRIIQSLQEYAPAFHFSQYGRTVTISLLDIITLIRDIINKIDSNPITQVCRYSSANSLHRIIESRKESMCGLAVMNDKSEGFFLDQCLSPAASSNIWTKPQYEIDEYNKAFITSLCDRSRSDDLTMWRLYGGADGDGVCLEYEVDYNVMSISSNMLLMPVRYGNNNNPIIQLFRLVRKLSWISGFQFVLPKDILRYFVKPDGFEIEKEYRLLLIRDKRISGKLNDPKWIFNPSYKIFHPIQELELSSSPKDMIKSPLVLKKIILGPKSKEPKVNKVQLRTWLKQLGLGNIVVEESAISFYR